MLTRGPKPRRQTSGSSHEGGASAGDAENGEVVRKVATLAGTISRMAAEWRRECHRYRKSHPILAELYYECGRTAEQAQVMELAAGNLALAYVMLLTDTNSITPEVTEWFKQVIEDIDSKTFGTVLKAIKKFGNFDDSLITIVDEALQKRNYFTHSFFRYHNFAIHSNEGRREMLADIIECQRKFDLAQTTLEGIASCLHQLAGRPADFGLEEVRRLEARGKRVKI